ncbi:hypothetical protein [Vogesella urethralis]|jgi:hypothetical protein|uniref:hypothetical protein n=1 Tax=Vogesella urethralis TaxID=2592656 RepID=UPI0011865692|nr:hypothetical protein [Vogesella urethralis]MEC5207798.1 hypothetical protein [Vogesella perlucida]
MRLTQTKTRQLCRLLVATWCLVFAFGVLLGCQGQAQETHSFATPGSLQALQLTAAHHAGTHDETSLCEQACQTLSSPLAKADVSVALPLLSSLLITWFLLPPLLLFPPAIGSHLFLPPATGGTPPRPHLLFQRFNN